MTIDIKDKQKAKEFAVELQSMAVWLTSLGSSTEPGEVECVCGHGGKRCRKKVEGTCYGCTRAEGHEGPCVACGTSTHDLTGALKREQESIDLAENNPDIRPEWWRELEEGEIIESRDVCRRQPSGKLCFALYVGERVSPLRGYYRLRSWRDMEEGEVIQEGDQWLSTGLGIWRTTSNEGWTVEQSTRGNISRYRTRRPKPVEPPKEPELRLPDGTDISGWPVIERGELMYKGDARFYPGDKWRLWGCDPIKITAHEFAAGNQFRRRVLPCRHCGGEAKLNSAADFWACSNIDCGQCGPSDDKGAIGWNQQNRKEEV